MLCQSSISRQACLTLQALDTGFGVQKAVVVAAQPLLELLDLRRGLLVQLLLLCVLKDIGTVTSLLLHNHLTMPCRPRALS